ncbi:Putative Tryptophan--tRNA ligase 2 gene leader peptide [Deinococcus deserti]|uniref:Putative Tryptophan--tRNA ligase 2 gene leader peptide n=1 Tax=Deinococcus deserti (strain DSM 17065 / CIP 109153 / LMG 22923 / VCD115) TaxID=546414 RepID=X5HLC9_DEIDV|nr:putative Tryptophan--tRNA ligase 2 gene leader peptide [Deinococcus deserti VCD115]
MTRQVQGWWWPGSPG